ncbi:MAG: ankyrin repeat domain-containing protein [Fusobacteriaceae bacterium]|nr:ankyrin repeat domain-containing protein [Fusobacteriaceae bacterium]MBN2837992.1 ankyrin repeat domain-containing protein [Fusobacteriaceae bacterium]
MKKFYNFLLIFILIFNISIFAEGEFDFTNDDEINNTIVENDPISVALEAKDYKTVKNLLSSNQLNANYVVNEDTGVTLLMWASYNAQPTLVKQIIEKGGNPNQLDKRNFSILEYTEKNSDTITNLANSNIDINLTDSKGNNILTLAVATGNSKAVSAVLNKNPNLTLANKNGDTAIDIAVNSKKSDELIPLLLEKNLDPNVKVKANKNIVPLAYWAIKANKLKIIEKLIEKNVTLESDTYNIIDYLLSKNNKELLLKAVEKDFDVEKVREVIGNKTISDWAIETNNNEILNAIMKKSTNLTKSINGKSPLELLIDNNKFDEIKALIESNGLNLDDFIDENKTKTLLSEAIVKNNLDFINYLISKKVDINKKVKDGFTPLMIAVMNDNLEVTKLLINNGADVDSTNNEGKKAKDYADSKEIKEFLKSDNGGNSFILPILVMLVGVIGLGFSIFLMLKNKFSDLEKSISNNDVFKVKSLIEKVKDINKVNSKGENLIFLITSFDQKEVLEKLVNKGCDVNCRNKYGDSPLLKALRNKEEALAKELFRLGANINVINNGFDPLALSIKNNLKEFTEILLNNGADLNRKYNDGKSLLHLLAEDDNIIGIKYLLGKNIEVNVEDNLGKTPLSYTKSRDAEEILKAAGAKF